MVSKYDFMSGQSDGQYTVYVTLLDSSGDMFNPPIVDHVSFGYQSSTGGTQSGGGDYQTPTSGTQSPDSIYILYPNVGTLYENNGNGLTVSWYYQSSYNASQSVSWAYKLDGGSYSSPVTGADSVNGSSWLSGLTADGGSHTLYVALLDQSTGNQLATDNHSFTYQSGDGSTQTETGGTGGGSVDSISIQKPTSGENVNSGTDELRISYSYSSASGGTQSPTWAYKLYDPNYGTPFSSYSSSHGGTQVNNMVSKYDFMSGQSDGQYTVYVTLLDSSGDMFNPPIVDHVSFGYQSSTGGTQSGGGDYQTPTSGTQSPDSIYILYPNVGTLYENNGNGLTVSWYYQSSYNASQSVSWAYKLDGGSYSSPVTGADSVNGSSWLSGLTADGGSHTLYVALLDQSTGNQLATDNHSFTYQSGDGSTQTETGGTGGGSVDSISIQKPTSGENVNSGTDELRISYSYSSASGGTQSPTWAYKLYDPNYGTPFSSYSSSHGGTQVNNMVSKYDFMSGQSDGQYTVYVTLLDSSGDMFNPPIVDHVSFGYQSSTGGTQSGGGDYQTPTSGTQSPDSIYILYPNVGTLYENNGNGLTVNWYYQSSYNASQSVSWAISWTEVIIPHRSQEQTV